MTPQRPSRGGVIIYFKDVLSITQLCFMIGLRGQCSWCASSKNPRRPDRDSDDVRHNDDGGDDNDADTNSMTPHIPAIVMGVGQKGDFVQFLNCCV